MLTITTLFEPQYRRGIALNGEIRWFRSVPTGYDRQILLYADDTVLISDSPEGLQRHINALNYFVQTKVCQSTGVKLK